MEEGEAGENCKRNRSSPSHISAAALEPPPRRPSVGTRARNLYIRHHSHPYTVIKAVENAGCDWIHVDVMDNRFVPNITIGPLIVDAIRPVTDLPLDIHLMIVEPEQRVPYFIKAGADIVSMHCENASTIHLHRIVNQIKDLGAKAGVVLNPGTPLDHIEYVLEFGVAWFVDVCRQLVLDPADRFQGLLKKSDLELRGPFNHFAQELVGVPRN